MRTRYTLLHLAATAPFAILTLLVTAFFWYPAPLDAATGAWNLVAIVLGVLVVLGPLLTLLVTKPNKPSLRADITVIVALQIAAFGYGVWTLAEGRPAWLVFSGDRFDLVRVNEIDQRRLADAHPWYRNPFWFGPEWVAVFIPEDVEERNEVLFEALATGIDLPHRPEYFVPLDGLWPTIAERAQPLDELTEFNPEEAVNAVRQRYPEADTWLPLMSMHQSMVVLLNLDDQQIVKTVNLRPWLE